MSRARAGSLLAIVLAVLASGCAEERKPINRVQANALKKSFFVGEELGDPADDPEFYSAATVIDVPYGVNHGLFSGLAGGLKRVKWEISESTLLARLSYETIEDVDGRGARTSNNGQVVAAYTILKHFDIRRSYNSSTGEELNVIEENETDRPWYERSYLRVDWSKNLISSSFFWDPLAQNELFDQSYDVEEASYYVEDPDHPDAPVFDAESRYFDITNKVYVTPKTIDVEGQQLPACLWPSVWVRGGNGETGVCESAEIKLRLSFRRVPLEGEPEYTDYEPVHWDGARMDAFGAFYEQRKGFDGRYGVLDDRWHRFASRYNIWQASTTSTPCERSADENRDGTDDACTSAGAGSTCNVFRQRCTIPYSQRSVRTLAWHYHLKPEDQRLFEQTERATGEWDTALRVAVQAARLVECRRTGGRSIAGTPWEAFASGDSPDERCRAAFPIDGGEEAELRQVEPVLQCQRRAGFRSAEAQACVTAAENQVAALPPVFVLCHNPVTEADHAACGEPGTQTRVGDLRYHSVNVWPTPESSSPWGFGPAWADPLSGEIVQASINIYDAVTNRAAQQLVDEARWLNGELPTAAVTNGDYVQPWSDPSAASARAGQSFLQLSGGEIDRRLGSLRHLTPDALAKTREIAARVDRSATAAQLKSYLRQNKVPPHLQATNRAEFDARVRAVQDTPVEAELISPLWAEAAGMDPSQPLSGSALDRVSPLRSMNAERLLDLEHHVDRRLAEKGMCLYHAPEPGGVPALGKLLARKFPGDPADPERARRMFDYVRSRMHYGVILHEMGHSVGLRHNFTSSYDAFNYRPQYWQLRTAGNPDAPACEEPTRDGASCVGPRYHDPLTNDEVEQSIETWAQTSVMDYAGEPTQDWVGLGVYDYAAARAIYADVVDVRNDEVRASRGSGTPGSEMQGLVDNPFSPWVFGPDGEALHYSQFARFFGLLRNCREVTPTPPPTWDEAKDGVWDPVFDGEVVRQQVCDRMPVDYVAWRDLRQETAVGGVAVNPIDSTTYTQQRRPVDGSGRIRMPYMFNSDEFRDGWTNSTMTRDLGADSFEQFNFWINQYENRHIFENFRRNRTGFSIVDAYTRALTRVHYKLSFLTQGASLWHDFIIGEVASNSGLSKSELLALYEGRGGPLREDAIAASLAFDHFMRVLTRPNVGLHYTGVPGLSGLLADGDRIGFSTPRFVMPVLIGNGSSVSPSGDVTFGGRPLTNSYQYSEGYHYYDFVDHIGSFYEKTFTFQAMLNATYRAPAAFSRFDGLDGRWRHTNFTNFFPDGIRRALGAMLTEDWELVAPRVALTLTGTVDGTREQDESGRFYVRPNQPMGWVSYVGRDEARFCWPRDGLYVCQAPDGSDVAGGGGPLASIPVEPQLGYETQKFALFWAYVYLPSSQVLDWMDMLRIYKTGSDLAPDYLPAQRVAFRDPQSGLLYSAKRYGDEQLVGKTYDKGIAAKMIQWANTLAARAYEVDEETPVDPETGALNYVLDEQGSPRVLADESIVPTDPAKLTCEDNRACRELRRYRALLDFSRDVATLVGFPPPDLGTR